MAPPPITVLMPVHNGARYLPSALASILDQSFAGFEFLICDDGSTDEGPALLARAAERDGRIRVLSPGRVGLAAALNLGLRAARGEWVARMDADDIARPQRLAVLLAATWVWPEAAAIGSAWQVVDEAGRPRRVVVPPLAPAEIAAVLAERNCLAHPTMLLHRDRVLACGGYREGLVPAEDYDLWLRLSERHEVACVADVLLDYREHPGQSSVAGLRQRLLAQLAAQVAARARREGRADPLEGAVDAAALVRAGVTAAELEAALTAGALGAARDALAAGHGAAAAVALRLLRERRGLHPRTIVHGWVLELRRLALGFSRSPPA